MVKISFFKKNKLFFKSPYIRLFYLHKGQVFGLFSLSLLSSSWLLAAPYISRLFIDKAFLNKDIGNFINYIFLSAVLFIISMLFKTGETVLKNKVTVKLKFDLTNKFIKKLYSLDLDFFQTKSVGENVYRLSDTDTMIAFITEKVPNLLVTIFKIPIILGVAFWLNVPMTMFLLIASPLFLLQTLYIQKKAKPIYDQIWRQSAGLSKKINEALSNILVVKTSGWESLQRRSYLKLLIENIRWQIRIFRWSVTGSLAASFLSRAISGIVALYGGWLIIEGRLSLGSYTAVMLYLSQLAMLLQSLTYEVEFFTKDIVSFERFFEVMETSPKIKDLPGAKHLKLEKGRIQFKDVWFGYQREKPVFKELNFTIASCSWVGIAGLSGCGKTTLTNLLLRLYEPWRGEISLGGIDLKMIKIESLKKNIGVAPQQPILFDLSIKENIGYGLTNISEAKIIKAAETAHVHDFISGLPRGYDTVIGEDACKLSGGFKQMIVIARTIIRDPYILILDEATSSIDSITEQKIFKALKEERQGLITIVISHRLSAIKDADRIYFLRDGGRVEEGSHNQLLSGSPHYKDFFSCISG